MANKGKYLQSNRNNVFLWKRIPLILIASVLLIVCIAFAAGAMYYHNILYYRQSEVLHLTHQ